MKRTRKDLEHQVETLNELLGGEEYFLEVMSAEVFGLGTIDLTTSTVAAALCARMTAWSVVLCINICVELLQQSALILIILNK